MHIHFDTLESTESHNCTVHRLGDAELNSSGFMARKTEEYSEAHHNTGTLHDALISLGTA